MNLTIATDKRIVDRARKAARARGVSLQELLRRYLESLAGIESADAVADALLELMRTRGGRSGGRRPKREDAYEGRL